MYFTNYEEHQRPELIGLKFMPLIIWKILKKGFYFYRIHYQNLKKVDYISNEIIELAKNNKNFFIYLDDTLEGYAYLNFKLVYDFVTTNNLENKVIYASGHSDVKKEYKKWKKNKNADCVFYVYHHSSWLWRISSWTAEVRPTASIDKNVWYSCLNNRPREHRLLAVTYLDYLNLLNDGVVSANDKDYEGNTPWEYKQILSTKFQLIDDKYVSILQKQADITEKKLPLIVDIKDLSNKCLPHDLSKTVYDKTLINLVTETFYFDLWNSTSEMFITEKTWKVFTAKQIPVIIGPRGIVNKVRSLGFDMFDDIVDHSYDNEPDSTRLFSAINSLKKIINLYSVEQLSTLTKTRRHINFKKLIKNIPLDEPVWKILNEN